MLVSKIKPEQANSELSKPILLTKTLCQNVPVKIIIQHNHFRSCLIEIKYNYRCLDYCITQRYIHRLNSVLTDIQWESQIFFFYRSVEPVCAPIRYTQECSNKVAPLEHL